MFRARDKRHTAFPMDICVQYIIVGARQKKNAHAFAGNAYEMEEKFSVCKFLMIRTHDCHAMCDLSAYTLYFFSSLSLIFSLFFSIRHV